MNTIKNNCYQCNKSLIGESRHGLHGECFKIWFDVKEIIDFKDVMAKDSGSDKQSGSFSAINSSFFHGKFRKYSADLGPHSYILKVQMADYPELPAAEFLCNKLAETLGIRVPDFTLITYNELPTFVTRNFIDKAKISNLVHIYRYLPSEEATTFGCESICKAIERETGRLQEIERFLELCLFDSLIGNNDRHGRNVALVESFDKKVLAPFYDNPSYLGVEIENLLGADHNPGGTVATATSIAGSSTMKDYVKEIERLGYSDVTMKFIKKVSEKRENIHALIEQSWMGQKRKQAFMKLFEKRYGELRHA